MSNLDISVLIFRKLFAQQCTVTMMVSIKKNKKYVVPFTAHFFKYGIYKYSPGLQLKTDYEFDHKYIIYF